MTLWVRRLPQASVNIRINTINPQQHHTCMRELELLAPAKNIESGIAAIDSGADAIYIGASKFGARQAVGNSIADIAELCSYAHRFGCKVYVTVNTIIYDDELSETQKLLCELAKAQVDAILVQDMGLLKLDIPQALSLHASTQTDNRTPEKTAWLASHGFSRIVLARELTIDEIAAIHKANPTTELEAFVHGALCVSYSGVCYASEYCFGRSANRGACAQFCRMKFELLDNDGNEVGKSAHLLSLKDMCRIENLEELADAGITSFKIEGRLKDINYVRNVTAAYSQKLNEIIERRKKDYRRASFGICDTQFTPNLNKSFNRGFTEYFLHARKSGFASFYTPKAIGEFVGKVKETRHNSFNVAGTATFANGDGLCFINSEGELEGFRVNKAEGNRLFPLKMPYGLKRGIALYRNNDQNFERKLAADKSKRKLIADLTLNVEGDIITLTATSPGTNVVATATRKIALDKAKTPQGENIKRQLSKLGATMFKAREITLLPSDFPWFVPNSILSELRKECMEKFEECLAQNNSTTRTNKGGQRTLYADSTSNAYQAERNPSTDGKPSAYPLPYMYNISNHLAKSFYSEEGLKDIQPAFELKKQKQPLIMQCRYCLRYEIGECKKNGRQSSLKDPLRLRLSDGKTFRLEFDCAHCRMNIYAD